MTALSLILNLNSACFGFYSTERPKEKASKSEIKRWFAKHSIRINGEVVTNPETEIDTEELDIVLFPKSEARRTSFRFN